MGAISIPGYEIERELGVGGMARVYLAIQSSLERRVALKVMAPALAADASFSKRFLREARTIASLTHPHIVAVYEVGVTNDHLHYFSMQFLPGGDFAQRMRKGVDQAEVVRVLCGIAKALGFAHQQGVVHRDVTPGNIMFDGADTPLLTDFGIARALSGSTRITSTGVSIGTSNYMSPEQARGGEVDARSDLYSLGVLAFEALSGRPPYQGPDGFAVAYAHVFEPIPRLPPALQHWQAFIDRALAKDPKDRFANADELILGLQQVEIPRGSTAMQTLPAAVGANGESLPAASRSSTTIIENLARHVGPAPREQGGRWQRYALMLVLAGGLMAVAYGVFRGPTAVPVAAVPEAQLPVAGKIPTPVPPTAVDVTAAPELPGPDSTDDDALTSLEPSAVDATDSDYSGDELGLPDAAEYGPVTPSKRISALLEFAQSLLPMQRLQLPPEANATLLFSRVLELEPDNEDARAGLAAVVDAYLQLARQDLDAGRVAEGKDRLDRARQVAATPGLDVAALNARIDLEWNTRIASLKTAARTALDEWRGADAENLISQALTLVPNDGELLKWMREAKVIGKPGYRFRDGADGPEMVIVGKGSVLLTGARKGSDLRVPIATPFAVGRREVSVTEFGRFVQAARYAVTASGCRDKDGGFFFSGSSKDRTWRAPGFSQTGDHPAVCVGHDDAVAYARWLSTTTGQPYRLLSEAEWQYLGSQVQVKPCLSGNRADQSYKKAEGGNSALSCDDGFAATAPSGRFEASSAGLYDIEGNVREHVADCANDSHAGRRKDQKARTDGKCDEHMIMGSAWHSDRDEPAVIDRRSEKGDWLSNTVGFRVARDLAPANEGSR
ncbi:MAG: bifunctional serine/threonine-protein kinase/formylglycine-generating enzyme family protein [Lysobacterales bacterium]|nr:SUMF1/EgtB/PvdO family nonheme iron enzyme [Xanthomonadales bacterium]